MTRRDELWAIYRDYANDPAFDRLKAHNGPKLLVPGRGSWTPRLVFVGEAPGSHENRTRKPFAGPAGRILNVLLKSVDLNRSEIFITNLVKYRPTIGEISVRNRTPSPDEQRASRPYLIREIEVFDPGTPVVLMGNTALRAFMPNDRIKDWHGRGFYDAYRMYAAMYHPAVAVYDESMMDVLLRDMARLREGML